MMFSFSRESFNVVHLSIGFLFVTSSFGAQQYLQEAIITRFANATHLNAEAGYYSLSIFYGVFTFANLISAPIVELGGSRLTLTISSISFLLFYAMFYFINTVRLYALSAVLGFASAGKYLAQNSNTETHDRNSAIFNACAQTSSIASGVLILTTVNVIRTSENALTAILLGISFAGTVLFAFLRPAEKCELLQYGSSEQLPLKQLLASTFALMFTKRMLVLAVAYAYYGILQTFSNGILTTAISFTNNYGANMINTLVGLNAVAQGVGSLIGCALSGLFTRLSKESSRKCAIAFATAVGLLAYGLVYLFFPFISPLQPTNSDGIFHTRYPLAFILAIFSPTIATFCGFLVGIASGLFGVEIYSLILSAYPQSSSQAFALFMFYQTMATAGSFYCGTILTMPWQVVIISAAAILAMTACFAVDVSMRRQRSDSQATSCNILIVQSDLDIGKLP